MTNWSERDLDDYIARQKHRGVVSSAPNTADTSNAPFNLPAEVVVTLPMPPTTNNLFANTKGKRYRTSEYNSWIKEAGTRLARQKPSQVKGKVSLLIEVAEPKTARQQDLGNREKATTDLLVRHSVIEGDDQRFVRELNMRWTDRHAQQRWKNRLSSHPRHFLGDSSPAFAKRVSSSAWNGRIVVRMTGAASQFRIPPCIPIAVELEEVGVYCFGRYCFTGNADTGQHGFHFSYACIPAVGAAAVGAGHASLRNQRRSAGPTRPFVQTSQQKSILPPPGFSPAVMVWPGGMLGRGVMSQTRASGVSLSQ